MKILGWMFAIVVVLAAAVLGYGFTLPSTVSLSRKIVIERPAANVFTVLNDLKNFNAWSPWFKLDPNAKYEYSGAPSGVGQIAAWKGNRRAGEGRQTITESKLFEKISTRLEFAGQGGAQAAFVLTPQNNGKAVSVEWRFSSDIGSLPWMRLLGAYVIKGAVAKDYESGLANLKAYAEKLPGDDFSSLTFEDVTLTPETLAYIDGASSQDPAAIGKALDAAFARIDAALLAAHVAHAGRPSTLTLAWADGQFKFRAGIPVAAGAKLAANSGVALGERPVGAAVKTVFQGPYAELAGVHQKAAAYLAARGLKAGAAGPIEIYVTDPTDKHIQPPITELYFPYQ